MTDTKGWIPAQHIDRACELVDKVEAFGKEKLHFVNQGCEAEMNLARLHIEIARAKMIGRQRA